MRLHPSLLLALLLLISTSSLALAQDADGDGVLEDGTDLCPFEDASGFDVDADGCLDPTRNTRHIEFWADADLPLQYVVHVNAAPVINDGSDFSAIQAGFQLWEDLPDSRLAAVYLGTTNAQGADGMDGIHQVTFEDPEFLTLFGSAVLAVGLTTSFEQPTNFEGRDVLAGQIVDGDMLFNPNRTFSTDTAAVLGTDLISVVAHEAGHLFGISHGLVESSTMFPALPGGTAARSFHPDDELMAFMANPEPAALLTASILEGHVENGLDQSDVAGAALYAIHAATQDTSGCTFSFPDGSYRFVGLPAGEYNLYVHPLDGSLGVQGVTPGFINELVENNVDELFVPEWYSDVESSDEAIDVPGLLVLSEGNTTTANIITNVDGTPPAVTEVTPAAGDNDIRIDAVVLVDFDEAIDLNSLASRFVVERLDISGAPQEQLFGPLTLITSTDVAIFDPNGNLQYDTDYRLTLQAGIADLYGNGTANDQVFTFRTEPEPPLGITSISPGKGVPGTQVVLAGNGFSDDVSLNTVTFGGSVATINSASANQLVLTVPEAFTGDVDVIVTVGPNTTPSTLFTVLSAREILRGNEFDDVSLSASPRDMVILPDGSFGYVSTASGVSVVSLGGNQVDYGQEIATLDFPGGTDGIDVTPDGRRVYAVSRSTQEMHVIISDYVSLTARSPLFNTVLATLSLDAEPLDVAVDPVGGRAYVPTRAGAIQIWDVLRELRANSTAESATFHRQIGEIATGAVDLIGSVVVSPDGAQVLVSRASGRLLSYATVEGNASLADVAIGSDPQDLAVDPLGLRCYIADGGGSVGLVTLDNYSVLPDVETGGDTKGVGISAGATVGFAADVANDLVQLIDLDANNTTFRSVAGDVQVGGSPVDVVLAPGGLTAYVLEQDPPRMRFLGIGFGPVLTSIEPRFAAPGTIVALRGEGFAPLIPGAAAVSFSSVDFDGTTVSPIYSDGSVLYARVPSGWAGGEVRVQFSGAVVLGEPSDPFSNPLYLSGLEADFLDDPSGTGVNLSVQRYDGNLGYSWPVDGVAPQVEYIPNEDILVLLDVQTGDLQLFDLRPGSPTFEQVFGYLDAGSYANFFVPHPDGSRLYVSNGGGVDVFDTDRQSDTFAQRIAQVDFAFIETEWGTTVVAQQLALSPGGEFLIVSNVGPDASTVWVELREGIVTEFHAQYEAFSNNEAPLINPLQYGVAVHPNGSAVYHIGAAGTSGNLISYGNWETQPNFTGTTTNIVVPHSPLALAPSPDGRILFVVTKNIAGVDPLRVLTYDIETDPYSPALLDSSVIDVGTSTEWAHVQPMPSGDQILLHNGQDLVMLNVNADDTVSEPDFRRTSLWSGVQLDPDVAVSPSGHRAYAVAQGVPAKLLGDRGEAIELLAVSGDDQVGVAGQKLPAPLRARLQWTDGEPRVNASVIAFVQAGGGTLGDEGQTQLYLETDADGFVSVDWTLGPEITPVPAPTDATHQVVFAENLDTPLAWPIFEATAVADPGTLPLDLSQILPADGATGVGTGTAVSMTFSRPVEPQSIGSTSFFLQEQGNTTLIPGVYGFANGNQTVTLLPLSDLAYSTTYAVTVRDGIIDTDGGALQDPGIFGFQTQLPPNLGIGSISPPSATAGTQLLIAGAGFDSTPANNLVRFAGGATAVPFKGDTEFLQVYAPNNAITGDLVVEANGQTSNGIRFTLLVPTDAPLDEVLATVQTGSTTNNMVVLPTGAKAYSVSTSTNEVQVIDLVSFTAIANIPVGNEPVSLVATPDGSRVYVANFTSGTLSVIDTVTDTVVQTIQVGPQPLDIVVSSDGANVYVVTVGNFYVNQIDTDPASATYNTVTLSAPAGASTKGAAISPDGGLLYLGIDNGFLVFELSIASFGVTLSVPTGSGTKGVAITPDGGLLILVTVDDTVLIVDVSEGGGNQVVLSVPAGSNTKGAAISPDGTLLYLIPEVGDEIIVVALEIGGTVSKVESGVLGGVSVVATIVDTITVNQAPNFFVFDPSGSGLAIVGSATQGDLTFLNAGATPFGTVDATVEVTPRTLNLDSKGRFISAHLELPPQFSVRNIQVDSVLLNDVLPANPNKTSFSDQNQDGIEEVTFKFDRFEFQDILPHGEIVPVKLTGLLDPDDRYFEAFDTIRTIRPIVTHPSGGETFHTGETVEIQWSAPDGYSFASVDVEWSDDDGESWHMIAQGVANTGLRLWTVPDIDTDIALLAVTAYDDKGDDIGVGLTADRFGVNLVPISVAMGSVDLSVEEGEGVLRWTAAYAKEFSGFHVLRGIDSKGPFQQLTTEALVGTDGSFVFRDQDVAPNRAYWYILQEAESGARHGPYKLSYVLRSSLAAAVPNPFNPQTQIQFSLARKGKVRLVVYDVAGRRVRTLKDEILEPDVYTVVWDGTDDRSSRVSSGIYLYRLEAPGFEETKKMVLLK